MTDQGISRHCCNYDYYICIHLEKLHGGDTLAQCPVIFGILREQPNRATLGSFSSLSASERSFPSMKHQITRKRLRLLMRVCSDSRGVRSIIVCRLLAAIRSRSTVTFGDIGREAAGQVDIGYVRVVGAVKIYRTLDQSCRFHTPTISALAACLRLTSAVPVAVVWVMRQAQEIGV